MKKREFISICVSKRPDKIVRRGMMLGRQIRQGLIDGVSDDCSQLLRNCFDKEHGVQDPYFSFGNDTIGVDKFQRAVNSARQKAALKDQSKSPSESAAATSSELAAATSSELAAATSSDPAATTPTD